MDQLTRNINQSIRDAGLTPLSPAQDYVDHIAAGYRTRIESLQARVGDLCKSNQATALTLLKTIIQHELPFLTEALPGIDKIAAEALAEEEAAPATETETLKSRLCGRLFELMNINGKDDIDGSNELETVTRDTVSFEELESRPYLLTDGSRVNFYNKATWERLQGDGTLPETRKDIALPGVPLVAPQLNEILAMLRMRDLISAAPPTPPPAPNPIPILRRRKAATRTPSPMTKKVSLKLAWADSDPLTDRSPADSPSSLLRDLCKQRYESWLTHCMATVHPSWTPHVDGDAFDQMFAFLQVSTPSKSDFHRTWLARFVEVRLTAPTSSSPDTSSSTESPLKPAFVAPGSSKETLDKVIALFEGQGVPRAEVESVLAEFPVEELEPVLGTAQQCLVEFYDNRVSLEDCANRKDQEERHAAKVELNAQLGLPPPPEFVYDVKNSLHIVLQNYAVPAALPDAGGAGAGGMGDGIPGIAGVRAADPVLFERLLPAEPFTQMAVAAVGLNGHGYGYGYPAPMNSIDRLRAQVTVPRETAGRRGPGPGPRRRRRLNPTTRDFEELPRLARSTTAPQRLRIINVRDLVRVSAEDEEVFRAALPVDNPEATLRDILERMTVSEFNALPLRVRMLIPIPVRMRMA